MSERISLNVKTLLFQHPSCWNSDAIRLHSQLSGSLLIRDSISRTRTSLIEALEGKLDDKHIFSLAVWITYTFAKRNTRKHSYSSASLFYNAQYELVSYCRKISATTKRKKINTSQMLSVNGLADKERARYTSLITLVDIQSKIDRLDHWSKYLLYLHIYEDMSTREIADMLGYAKSSVHESIQQTLAMLRSTHES